MTATSDLDLVLVYRAPEGIEASDGAKPLPVSTYYARLTQRLINALTAPTGEGRLYAVDMRLRPSGTAGPIASSFDAFRRYHAEAAWTWERMALTRARVVGGDPALGEAIAATVRAVLVAPRDPAVLLADVAEMRRRIEAGHRQPAPLDLKQRRGGLVDIEFMAQYLVLRHAPEDASVLAVQSATQLVRLQEGGWIGAAQAGMLRRALGVLQHVQAVLRVAHGTEAPLEASLETLRRARRPQGSGARPTLKSLDRIMATVLEIYRQQIDVPAGALPPRETA